MTLEVGFLEDIDKIAATMNDELQYRSKNEIHVRD